MSQSNRSRVVGSFAKKSSGSSPSLTTPKPTPQQWPGLSDEPLKSTKPAPKSAKVHKKQQKITLQTFSVPVKIGTPISQQQETLQFLRSLFDTISVKQIESTLSNCSFNLDIAIELLLEIIDKAESDPSSSPTLSLSTLSLSQSSTASSPVLSSFMLSRDDYAREEFILAESAKLVNEMHQIQPEYDERAAVFDAFIMSGLTPCQHLIMAFPLIPKQTILEVLEACELDIIESHFTLASLPPEGIHPLDTLLTDNLGSLKTMFPQASVEDLFQLLLDHEQDVESVAEILLRKKQDGERGPLDQLREMFPAEPEARLVHALQTTETLDEAIQILITPGSQRQQKQRNAQLFTLGSGLTSSLNHTAVLTSASTQSLPTTQHYANLQHDSAYYRNEATQTHINRVDLYKRAATSFRRGSLTGQASASYYAGEASALTAKMRRQNEQAAFQILAENRERGLRTQGMHYSEIHQNEHNMAGGALASGKGMIDLHGLTVAEAIKHALEYVTKHFTYMQYRGEGCEAGVLRVDRRSVKVVTGSGLHSDGGVARLYPSLSAFFRKEGYKVEDGHGRAWFMVREK